MLLGNQQVLLASHGGEQSGANLQGLQEIPLLQGISVDGRENLDGLAQITDRLRVPAPRSCRLGAPEPRSGALRLGCHGTTPERIGTLPVRQSSTTEQCQNQQQDQRTGCPKTGHFPIKRDQQRCQTDEQRDQRQIHESFRKAFWMRKNLQYR